MRVFTGDANHRGLGKMTQQFTISPEGTITSTQRRFDDPDFQRCDGCDSGFIVEDPTKPWPCFSCSHINEPRPCQEGS